MAADLRRVLRKALEARGWSVQRLLDESGLSCDRSSLHRKLYGMNRNGERTYQGVTVDEFTRLARTLGVGVADEGQAH